MPRTDILIKIILLSFTLSCGNSPNDSKGGAFELEIAVVDGAGNPVSGLQVSAWNEIDTALIVLDTSLIVDTSSVGNRGDINCNGRPYEMADYVSFKNYLLQGESAFNDHVECSIVGGDADHDGLPLTLSDFVFLIRVIRGDSPPSPPRPDFPESGSFSFRSGVVTVYPDISVLLLKFEGPVVPTLLDLDFNLSYQYDVDSNSTMVLISLPLENARVRSFSDDILEVDGGLLEISGVTFDGTPVVFWGVFSRPTLGSPYPNPFNPSFVVRASIPNPAVYVFSISNLEGELQHQVIDSTLGPDLIGYRWGPQQIISTTYRIELEVRVNDTVFTLDPQYAAMVTFDPDDNIIGVTSTRGLVNTFDAWRFPSLFDLPVINRTDAFGNALGFFSYSDSVTVVLKRQNTAESKSYRMHLQRGINRFNLVWPF